MCASSSRRYNVFVRLPLAMHCIFVSSRNPPLLSLPCDTARLPSLSLSLSPLPCCVVCIALSPFCLLCTAQKAACPCPDGLRCWQLTRSRPARRRRGARQQVMQPNISSMWSSDECWHTRLAFPPRGSPTSRGACQGGESGEVQGVFRGHCKEWHTPETIVQRSSATLIQANSLTSTFPTFRPLTLFHRPRRKCIGDFAKGCRRGRCPGIEAQVLCICRPGSRQQEAKAVATVGERQSSQEEWLRCRCHFASSDQECPAVHRPCFTYLFICCHHHPE